MCVCLFVDPDRLRRLQQWSAEICIEIADAIYNAQTFQDTLNAIDADMLGDYYRIDAADLSDSKVYVSGSFSTAEEIAVFQASSSDAVENIKRPLIPAWKI